MPQLVVFDLDGTLSNSHESIVRSFQHALTTTGLPDMGRAQITGLIGLPLTEMFEIVAPQVDQATRDAAVQSYKAVYLELDREHGSVFAGPISTVRDLHERGVQVAIATSKSQRGVERFARENELENCFRILVSNDSVSRPKPDPEMLEIICQHTGVPTGVMVGDSIYDIEMGKRAGFQTIGVTWGSHDADRLRAAGATWIAETPGDLGGLLDDA